MDEILIGSVLGSTLRVTAPLLLCALAGLISERSGVIDLGLEGKMLFAAFAAGAAGFAGQSAGLGVLAAVGVACMLSWLHGYACVSHRGDQVISGMAINMVAAGLTVVLGIAWFAQGGQTPAVDAGVRLTGLSTTYSEPSAGFFNAVIGHGLLSHNILVYIAFALVAGVWFFLERTKPGLRLRAVGENPAMVDAAGVSVPALRYAALTLNGVLCGLAGSYLVLAQNANFSPNMTAGRGYIALAAMIFGKWKPVPTLFACLLFGFLDAVAIRMQGVAIPGIGEVPVQLIQALPYILTVILLAGFIGQALAPKALGRPYVKGTLMFALNDEVRRQLLTASLAARAHSHSPYSKYAVGAAILDEQGRIHAGANIENAAYPQGWCAEATALSAMVMAGGRQALAVLVTGPGPDLITPCGGCRQKLREFAAPDLIIIAGDASGIRQQWTLAELLPFSFGQDNLKSVE